MKYRKVKSEKKLQQVPIYFLQACVAEWQCLLGFPWQRRQEKGKREERDVLPNIRSYFQQNYQDLWTGPTGGKHYLVLNLLQAEPPQTGWLLQLTEVPLHAHIATIHQPRVSNSVAKPNSSFHEAMESFYDPALARETLYKPGGEGLRAPQASRSTSPLAALPSDPVPCISVHIPTEGLGGQPSHVWKHVEGRHLILLSRLQHPITHSDEVLHEADNKKSSVVPMLLAWLH